MASAQNARPAGVYFRAAPVVTGFDLAPMTFRLDGRRSSGSTPPSFSGKQLLLGRSWLPGASLGVNVDAPWFYVRVGADLYQSPTPGLAEFAVTSTTSGWIAAGPRFVFGAFSAQAGLRIGALLLDVERRQDGAASQRYTSLGAMYAVDVGAQWRPLRWLQVDVAVGQDLFGPTSATTFSTGLSVGWSRAPSP